MPWETKADGTAAAPQPSFTPQQRDSAILAWRASRTDLAAIKEQEMSQRKSLSDMLFPNPSKGTQRYDLGGGYQVKLVHKLNFKFIADPKRLTAEGEVKPVNVQVEDVQDEIEKLGNEGAFLADRLVKWKPELSVSEYQALDMTNPTHKRIKALIDSILSVEPASPELTLEEPKAK